MDDACNENNIKIKTMLNKILRLPFMLSRMTRLLSPALFCIPQCRTVASNEPKPHQVLSRYLALAPNTVWDNPGASRRRKRVGRGPGSGKGKTCGRGIKGKKARSGKFHPRYEGGQTPLQRRVPKSGFTKRTFRYEPTTYVNLDKILYHISKGKLDPTKKITIKDLVESGTVSNPRHGVCLLGRGGYLLNKSKMPNGKDPIPSLHIEVSSATTHAISSIKSLGGSVTCVYRTKLTLRHHVKPEKWEIPINDPQTPPKKIIKMEKLKEKGAEVVYTSTEWFKNPQHWERIKEIQEIRSGRTEKLRALGEGTRIRPMLARKLDYFGGGKTKKGKAKAEGDQEHKEKKGGKKGAKEGKKEEKGGDGGKGGKGGKEGGEQVTKVEPAKEEPKEPTQQTGSAI